MNEEHDDNTRTHIVISKGTQVSHYTIIEKIDVKSSHRSEIVGM